MINTIRNEAKLIREEYNLNTPPINVEEICKKLKISVERVNLSKLEKKCDRAISGLIYVDKNSNDKRIFVNENDLLTRQNFTIAHELGHYFLHISNDDNGVIFSFRGLKNERERQADLFAVELLMPQELVREEYNKLPFPTASYLANIFNVSKEAMVYRLKELGLTYIGR